MSIPEDKSNLRKKRRRKTYSITITLIAAILAVLVVWMYYSTKEYRSAIHNNNERFEELEFQKEMYAEIIIADNLVFERDYEEALMVYEKISPSMNADNKAIITKRIERVKRIMETSGNDNDGVDQYKDDAIRYKDSIRVLLSALDSVQRHGSVVSERSGMQLEVLRQNLEQKERLLNQKDNLQVISFNNAEEKKIYYMGEVKNSKANGGGIGIWTASGSIYRGEWKDNLRHGRGIFEWADGVRYEGEFNNDIREGEGIYYWLSGERYEGEWKDRKRNGFGILYDPDGNIQFEGQWMDDKPVRD